MAATRKAPAKKAAASPEKTDEQQPQEAAEAAADQGVVRGGYNVGFRGTRVDDEPDEAYSVTGVLAARGKQ